MAPHPQLGKLKFVCVCVCVCVVCVCVCGVYVCVCVCVSVYVCCNKLFTDLGKLNFPMVVCRVEPIYTIALAGSTTMLGSKVVKIDSKQIISIC